MTPEAALRRLILDALTIGDADPLAAVQSSSDRVKPHETAPVVLYSRIGGGSNPLTDDGPSGVGSAPFQVDTFTRSIADAIDLTDRIRIALHGYSGVVTIAEGQTVEVLLVEAEEPQHVDAQPPPEAPERRVVRYRQDVTLHYRPRRTV